MLGITESEVSNNRNKKKNLREVFKKEKTMIRFRFDVVTISGHFNISFVSTSVFT